VLNLPKVAITGAVASGKSTVCKILEKWGACCVSSDDVAHRLISQGGSCAQKVVDLLGPAVLEGDEVDRKRVASIVFQDREKLLSLEEIVHPCLFREIEKEYEVVRRSCEPFLAFVVELPLVQEVGREGWFDLVVAVACEENLARERFVKRGLSEEDFERRMDRHWKVEDKGAQANFTIVNNGSLEDLEGNVKEFLACL